MGGGWSPADARVYRLYDAPPVNPAVSGTALTSLSTPSPRGATEGKPFHPDNPLLVYGVLAALTFGFMAFSTSGSVRVGKTTATAGVGIGSTK